VEKICSIDILGPSEDAMTRWQSNSFDLDILDIIEPFNEPTSGNW
jgi:hypothetical protein